METNIVNGRHYRVEVLLNNLVDKDVQSLFSPLNILQAITLCPNYRIKDSFITPNSLFSNISSLIVTITIIVLYIYRLQVLYFETDTQATLLNSLFYQTCFHSLGHVIFYINSVRHTGRNVDFVLTIQKIYRFLNDADTTGTKRFTKWNWVIVSFILILISVVVLVYTVYFWYLLQASICHLIIGFTTILDINIIYAVRLLKLLEIEVHLWNIQAVNTENIELGDSMLYNKSLFETFDNILKCFEIFKTSFRHLVLYHLVEVFTGFLIYFQLSLDLLKQEHFGIHVIVSSSAIYFWLLKNLVLQIILGQYCEKFYKAMTNVRDTCGCILKSHCSDDKKRLCKNVQRLYRASFTKLSVFGLFDVDASLSAHFMSNLTDYVIVLLQFSFL